MSAPDERNRVVIERMAHRDPFVLAAADAIALAVPGGGRARDAVRAREGVLRLSAIAHNVSLAELDDNDLQRWRAVVSDDVAAIDRRLAGGTDAAGIDELNALAATIDPAWARVRTPASPVGGTPERVVDARQFEERRQEIEQLLRAIEARGDERLAQRARALRGQLPSLAPAGGPAPDAHAVAEQLAGVRQALQALRAAGGGRLADDAEALGNRARQQAFAGVAENTRAARQWEMLTLLETAGDRATLLVRARLAEVLGAAAQLPAQDDAVLRDRRDQKQRLLERIGLEQQLRRSSGPSAAPAAARAERASAASALGLLRSRLRTLENGTPASPLEPDRAASAVKGLLNACTKCHRLDDHETGIRPVAAAARPMHAVAFDHKPHVLQTSCETCHGAVQTSRAGTDVNLPPLDTCQSCHGAKAPATCLTCHMYHPKSVTDLMRAAAR
jgi:hypothetical protein